MRVVLAAALSALAALAALAACSSFGADATGTTPSSSGGPDGGGGDDGSTSSSGGVPPGVEDAGTTGFCRRSNAQFCEDFDEPTGLDPAWVDVSARTAYIAAPSSRRSMSDPYSLELQSFRAAMCTTDRAELLRTLEPAIASPSFEVHFQVNLQSEAPSANGGPSLELYRDDGASCVFYLAWVTGKPTMLVDVVPAVDGGARQSAKYSVPLAAAPLKTDVWNEVVWHIDVTTDHTAVSGTFGGAPFAASPLIGECTGTKLTHVELDTSCLSTTTARMHLYLDDLSIAY